MKQAEEKVILVDENDHPVGLMPKMEAHQKGLLHRAFSVFILDDRGRLLLQQRAAHKYHSPALWTNTVCSHPRQGEGNIEAGIRRLKEEMGFSAPLQEVFSFIYKAEFDNGLTEHELDHVLIGKFNGKVQPNPEEVMDYKWVYLSELVEEIQKNPGHFTAWFKIIFEKSLPKLLQAVVSLYPDMTLSFEPVFVEKPWGSDKLKKVLHKNIPSPHTGESWEISAVPGKSTKVSDGVFKGFTLEFLWQHLDDNFFGSSRKKHSAFPLLIKYIDAADDLSVQVHPGDDVAMKKHNSFGKNETWQIIEADEGAALYIGLKPGITEENYLKLLEKGTLEQILNKIPVKPGDWFYIPAGTVHAIGKGVLLAEIQQSSDITYRIFDWNRPGLDGKPRELHTQQALEVINIDAKPHKVDDNVLKTPYFHVENLHLSKNVNFPKHHHFTIYMNNHPGGTFEINGKKLDFGQTLFVPAGIDIKIKTLKPGILTRISPE